MSKDSTRDSILCLITKESFPQSGFKRLTRIVSYPEYKTLDIAGKVMLASSCFFPPHAIQKYKQNPTNSKNPIAALKMLDNESFIQDIKDLLNMPIHTTQFIYSHTHIRDWKLDAHRQFLSTESIPEEYLRDNLNFLKQIRKILNTYSIQEVTDSYWTNKWAIYARLGPITNNKAISNATDVFLSDETNRNLLFDGHYPRLNHFHSGELTLFAPICYTPDQVAYPSPNTYERAIRWTNVFSLDVLPFYISSQEPSTRSLRDSIITEIIKDSEFDKRW